MSVNVIERNDSDCKYVEIFTHHVGSIGAPSRTVFIRRTNTKQWEIPKIAGINTKANIFQKRSAGFEVKIDLKQQQQQFNSIQFFIIYVPSQQLQGQLHTQHTVVIYNIIIIIACYIAMGVRFLYAPSCFYVILFIS
jgi:hypothetical protein